MAKKKHKKKVKRKGMLGFLVLILAIIIIAVALFKYSTYLFPPKAEEAAVAAYVNGEPIYMADLNEAYDSLPDQYKSFITKEALLEQMEEEKILLMEAEKLGFTASDEEVNTLLDEALAQSPYTMDEFEAQVAEQGMTMDDVRDYYRKQVLVTKLLNETVISKATVTEQEIEDYYNANPSLFQAPETIRASHILVDTEEEAQEVLEMLQNGSDFAELARERSIDTGSAQLGGDLDFFPRGVMVPEFENAAFALDVGELSDIVKTDFGYHIILVTDKSEARTVTLAEAHDQIQQQLEAEKQRTLYLDYINNLKSSYDVVPETGILEGESLEVTDDTVDLEAFASCLADKGAVVYGAVWCTSCKKQADMFGDSWSLITYVECADGNTQTVECTEAGITGYPTWVIDGEQYLGWMDLGEISTISGCPLS